MKRLIFFAVVLLACPLFAKGLDVVPSSYHWTGISPGKKIVMPVPIKITNHSGQRRHYTLQAKTPAEINSQCAKGFKPIPKTGWVSFGTDEVAVLPGAEYAEKVYLHVPLKKIYFNRSYMFYIEVKEKGVRGERFVLACYPKIFIKTKKTGGE